MALLNPARRRALPSVALSLSLSLSLALAIAACSNREHLNPLDPENPETGGVPWQFSAVAADRSVSLRWIPQELTDLG
jgi:hypothetical protein